MNDKLALLKQRISNRKALDERFSDYMALYINLDRLIWGIPALLLGATVIGVGIVTTKNGTLLTAQDGIAWILFLILSIINALGAISIGRLRQHHTLVGNWLADMEDSGYFHKRKQTISKWWKSAPNWFFVIFIVFSIASFSLSLTILFNNPDKNMKVSTDIVQFGIQFNSEAMENGELRFRLNSSDGSAYIRTESGDSGAWQNSHFHLNLEETYIVQKGWIAVAELLEGELNLRIEKENCLFTSKPNVPHNIYMAKGAVIHTVKHGNVQQGDWHESKELDALTKHLSEADILKSGK